MKRAFQWIQTRRYGTVMGVRASCSKDADRLGNPVSSGLGFENSLWWLHTLCPFRFPVCPLEFDHLPLVSVFGCSIWYFPLAIHWTQTCVLIQDSKLKWNILLGLHCIHLLPPSPLLSRSRPPRLAVRHPNPPVNWMQISSFLKVTLPGICSLESTPESKAKPFCSSWFVSILATLTQTWGA